MIGGVDRPPRPVRPKSLEATARLLFDLLRKNPALSLSLLYLLTTLLGGLYQWALLQRFDINIVEFAQVSDLLLAAFRDPTTVPNGLAGVLFWAYMNGRHPLQWWPVKVASVGLLGFIVISFPVGLGVVSGWNIERGWGTYAHVELTRPSASLASDSTLMLAATSQSYLFLYDRASERHYVIPIANVAVIRLCEGKPDRPCIP